MYRTNYFIWIVALIAISCSNANKLPTQEIFLDTIDVGYNPELEKYRASRTRHVDLIHTALDLQFNIEKQQAFGEAKITFTPLIYPQDSIVLDAKGFEIGEIKLDRNEGFMPLTYAYDGFKLKINLDRIYKPHDTLEILIEYLAKPSEIKQEGSSAIRSARGLYFINADRKVPNKPIQIWSQGETEANSCWFPTFDSPNEKMTQEIKLTVDNRYKTLSNGVLEFSSLNEDGTRTDYWKQSLPHSPYLVMLAIGEYAVVKDQWENIEVNYWVEPKYEPFAKEIFNHTPEMLTFFSTKFGMKYPWEKFDQVIVRDFVSGAMENTTGVVFGEFIQKNDRELLDQDNDDIVAHEMAHHWFGDVVTTESWSNIPLNESFATYASALWREHKYGKDYRDYSLNNNRKNYLGEAEFKQVDLIRFHYESKEDLFDNHSYSKGAAILHLLRMVVGDDAFFAALKLYLADNAFKPVEAHQLRLAFEEITGKDMNWFFNQWFFAKGHPKLEVDYLYNESNGTVTVFVEQKKQEDVPMYDLPVYIDVHSNGSVIRKKVWVKGEKSEFVFNAIPRYPDLVNFDAEHYLLADIQDNKQASWYEYQFHNAFNYDDRRLGLENAISNASTDTVAKEIVMEALKDPFWAIRELALQGIRSVFPYEKEQLFFELTNLSRTDQNAQVRKLALANLVKYYSDNPNLMSLLEESIADKSYEVVGVALDAHCQKDKVHGLMLIQNFRLENSQKMKLIVGELYAKYGNESHFDFYVESLFYVRDPEKSKLLKSLSDFAIRIDNNEVSYKAIEIIEREYFRLGVWWLKYEPIEALNRLKEFYSEKLKTDSENQDYQTIVTQIETTQEKIRVEESDERLIMMIR